MIALRSNLGRMVASGITEAEAEEKRQKAERDAFLSKGLVVISIDDPELPGALKTMIEAIGRNRFGPRPRTMMGEQ